MDQEISIVSLEKLHNNNKDYHKQYYQQHKEEWYTYTQCSICGGKYSRSTRTHHFRTKKHIIASKDAEINNLRNKLQMFTAN